MLASGVGGMFPWITGVHVGTRSCVHVHLFFIVDGCLRALEIVWMCVLEHVRTCVLERVWMCALEHLWIGAP